MIQEQESLRPILSTSFFVWVEGQNHVICFILCHSSFVKITVPHHKRTDMELIISPTMSVRTLFDTPITYQFILNTMGENSRHCIFWLSKCLMEIIKWRGERPYDTSQIPEGCNWPTQFQHGLERSNIKRKVRVKEKTLLASKNGGHCISSKSRSAQYGTSNRSISLT